MPTASRGSIGVLGEGVRSVTSTESSVVTYVLLELPELCFCSNLTGFRE